MWLRVAECLDAIGESVKIKYNDGTFAPVAQWIEYLTSNQLVGGSSPSWGAKNSLSCRLFF